MCAVHTNSKQRSDIGKTSENIKMTNPCSLVLTCDFFSWTCYRFHIRVSIRTMHLEPPSSSALSQPYPISIFTCNCMTLTSLKRFYLNSSDRVDNTNRNNEHTRTYHFEEYFSCNVWSRFAVLRTFSKSIKNQYLIRHMYLLVASINYTDFHCSSRLVGANMIL